MSDERPQLPGSRVGPLTLRIARAIVADSTDEYTAEEKARVKDALDDHPDRLARVLSELFKEKGGAQ